MMETVHPPFLIKIQIWISLKIIINLSSLFSGYLSGET